MPEADCPSFHCRPSTERTVFSPSFSIRQTPTTLKNDFGSAPTVSAEKSATAVCCATAGIIRPTSPMLTMAILLMPDMNFMTNLHCRWEFRDARWTANPPPRDQDEYRKPAKKPRQRCPCISYEGITRVIVAWQGSWWRHVR